jgi:hypothetical protein
MLKKITFIRYIKESHELLYHIYDSRFSDYGTTYNTNKFMMFDNNGGFSSRGTSLAASIPAVIGAYTKMNAPIPINIALMYKRTEYSLIADKVWMDVYFPELRYSEKFYPCVLNYCKNNKWGKT